MEQPGPTEQSVKPHGLWGELGLLLHHKDILGHNCITCLRHISPVLQPDTKVFQGDAAPLLTPERCLPPPCPLSSRDCFRSCLSEASTKGEGCSFLS